MMNKYHHTEFGPRPRMLLAYADAAYASECGRYFRRLGWEVEMVGSAQETRLFVEEFRPDVVVLAAELLDESGWLTSAKISTADPDLHIIVVAAEWSDNMQERANAVGAERCIRREDGAEGLAHAVLGSVTLSHAV
ncbi:MAG TPA: response regulator [Gemmataceae bacterium]|nr:response regulator [Gemmataceae bacterium]